MLDYASLWNFREVPDLFTSMETLTIRSACTYRYVSLTTFSFQSNNERRSYLVHLNMWKRLLGRRQRCRDLMAVIGGKYYISNTSRAFAVIRR